MDGNIALNLINTYNQYVLVKKGKFNTLEVGNEKIDQ